MATYEQFDELRVSWRLAKEGASEIQRRKCCAVERQGQSHFESTALIARVQARVEQARGRADRTRKHCGNGCATSNNSGYIVTLCGPCRRRADLLARRR